MKSTQFSWLAWAALLSNVYADSVSQNYSICNWARLRAGVIRDAIYLDGGLLWWQTAFVDGSTPVVSSDGNVAGNMWRLNLSRPFDLSSTNTSTLLDTLSKAGGAANNIAPNYVDGTMFTNDDELYLYGGLSRLTDSVSPQPADAVLGYEAYQYGPHRDSWSPGFIQSTLSQGVTRYITNGAGVSAPSENMGFYFSGMRSPTWGPISYEDSSANVSANTLISVDMSTMRDEKWSNETLPDEITPRANAELVWLPVSEAGVLLAIGGVTEPEEIWAGGLNDTQITESKAESPSLMKSIPIYDVSSKRWFVQNTTGNDAPPQLTEFCSVVAITSDASSFNIYIYGGYDGLNADDPPSDDVWVLSVPAFEWTKVYSGHLSHGRSSHKCISPYPDRMFVIGGMHLNQAECLEGGFIQTFNLNSLEFEDVYNPSDWSEYKEPGVLASKKAPRMKRAVQWSDPELQEIFSTKYQKEIKHFYPYKSDKSFSSDGGSSSGHHTNAVAIGIGVAAAVVVLALIFLLVLVFRRRGHFRRSTSESTGTKFSRISNWITGTQESPKCPVKQHFDDDDSSLTPPPMVQRVQSMESEPPTPPTGSNGHSTQSSGSGLPTAPAEMAAVERPRPPFELATPYNISDAPRHTGVKDYGYSATKGHSSLQSNSRSTSSDYDNVPLASPQDQDPKPSYGAPTRSSTSSIPGWPFPSSRPIWFRSHSKSQSADQTTLLPPSSTPYYPAGGNGAAHSQYRSLAADGPPDRLRPVLPEQQESAISSQGTSNESSKHDSDVSGVVSPVTEGTLNRWRDAAADETRRKLMAGDPIAEEDFRSPVSPDDTRAGHAWMWAGGGATGQHNTTIPRKAVPVPVPGAGPAHRDSSESRRSEREDWWR